MVETKSIVNKEVSWVANGITIKGTLTYSEEKMHCGVVFVAGSGPTDRDWCSPLLLGSNGSAKLLAELLAYEGFVTLRYDKAASGPNAQENAAKLTGRISMQSHLEELSGAVKTLVGLRLVAEHCIFALTNSEGAIHAINYQLQAKTPKLRGLVLTGAPGRAIGTVARSQIYAQIKDLPNSKEILEKYDYAIADFLAEKLITPDPTLPELMQQVLLSLSFPVNLPFSRELWSYDPAKTISAVDVPILVVIGKKDIQVNYQEDGKALEAATANNPDATFVYPENANHVLKYEATPREQLTAQRELRYNAADTHLDMDAARATVDWLKVHSE
ncbi:MAG: alpha/beta hydrolase [Methanocella sp.]